MTYQDFIKKNDSQKRVLFEIDLGVKLTNSKWIEFETGIWMLRYAWDDTETRDFSYGIGAMGWGSYGSSETEFSLPASTTDQVFKLSSVTVDVTNKLIRVENIEALRALTDAFFFDDLTQVLYLKTTSVDLPPSVVYSSIVLGVTKGYSNNSGYYGSLYYDGRVKSIPQINTDRDSLYYGKISFEGGSTSLINTDGFFDKFGSEDYYGSEVRILFGGDDIDVSEYETVYTGYVEDYKFSSDKIIINYKDSRKQLSTSVPVNRFNLIDYPDLDDGNNGEALPIGYGSIKKAVAICTNEALEEQTTYDFKFIDTSLRSIKSISKVYVNNKSVAFTNPDIENGSFSLAGWDGVDEYTVFESGDTVTVSFEGYVEDDGTTLMDNPIDIIQDLLVNYSAISFNSAFFNLVEWEEARAGLDQKIGLSIAEPKEIIDAIGEISSSVLGLFIVQGDGKFSFKMRDTSAESVTTINIDSLVKPSAVDLPSKEYLNSVRVKYNRSWESEKGSFYLDDSKKEELFNIYRSNVEKEFETVLSEKADAVIFATDALETFGGIKPTYTIFTKTQNMPFNVGQNINLEVGKFSDSLETGKYIKCEILSKSVDLNSFVITFKVRYIEDINAGLDIVELIRYDSTTTYQKGAVTSSGGQLWRAIDITVSNPPQPSSDFWDEFGKLYWMDFVQYYTGDIVVHNGVEYQATTDNLNKEPTTGTEWIELGKSYWRSFVVYAVGDIVIHDGIQYQSKTINTNKEPSVETDWIEIGKLNWRNFSDYVIGDLVVYENIVWQSIQDGTNQEPSTTSLYWTQYGKGTWNNKLKYVVGDLVSHDGFTWQSKQDGTNQEPSLVSAYWNQFITSSGLPPDQLVTKILTDSGYSVLMWQNGNGEIFSQQGSNRTSNSSGGLGFANPSGASKVSFPANEDGVLIDAAHMNSFSFALFDNGNLYTWGKNDSGQLGLGDLITRYSPVLASGSVQRVFSNVGVGYHHTNTRLFIEKTDNKIYAAGDNGYGQLGNGNTSSQTYFVEITALGTSQVRELWNIGATLGVTFCQKNDGTILVIGAGHSGSRGDGSTATKTTWTDVTTAWGGTGQVTKFSGGYRGWNGTTAYNYNSSYCLRDDGTLYSCGRNSVGQLGDGTTVDKSTPVQVAGIGTVREFKIVGSGPWVSAFAVNDDDELWRWGYNGTRGILGLGNTTNQPSPQNNNNASDTNIDTILNRDMTTSHTDQFAMNSWVKTKDGVIYVAGDGNSGCAATVAKTEAGGSYLGDVSTYSVSILPQNFVEIVQSGHDDGGFYCLAKDSDGKIYFWGYQNRANGFPDAGTDEQKRYVPRRIIF